MTSIVRFGRYQVVLLKTERDTTSVRVKLQAAMAELKRYRENIRQRQQLAQLPDYMLKDIGVSRADALHEAGKPFWK